MDISLNKLYSPEELERLENSPVMGSPLSTPTLQENDKINENPDLTIDTNVTSISPPSVIRASMPVFNHEEFFNSIEEHLYMKSLRQAVHTLLNEVDAEKRYNIEISSNVKFILQTLMEDENFNYFDVVEDNLKQIIKDDQINVNDIPYIIQLIADLYKRFQNTTIHYNEELCGEVLKIIFLICVQERLVSVSEHDYEILQCLYNIINTSVQLMNLKTKPGKKLCDFFNRCIKKSDALK